MKSSSTRKGLKRGGLEEATAAAGPSVSGSGQPYNFLKTREPKAEEKSTHAIIFLPRPSTGIAPL